MQVERLTFVKQESLSTALQIGVEEGFVNLVQSLLDLGLFTYMRHMQTAIDNQDSNMLECLLSAGNESEDCDMYVLMKQVARVNPPHLGIVDILLKHWPQDENDPLSLPEIIDTCYQEDVDNLVPIIPVLVDYGASLSATDEDDCTSLYLACRKKAWGLAETLFQFGGYVQYPNMYEASPLHEVCRNGNMQLARLFVQNGALRVQDTSGFVPIFECLCKDSLTVEQLLEIGVDPWHENSLGQSALHFAVENSREQGISDLVNLVPALVTASDQNGVTPLHLAHDQTKLEFLETMLQSPMANPVQQDRYGYSLQFHAAWVQSTKILGGTVLCDVPKHMLTKKRWLTGSENGILVLAQNHIGCFKKIVQAVRRGALERGFDIDAVDPNGWTTLCWVAFFSVDVNSLDLLIENGANPRHLDNQGRNLLHLVGSSPSVQHETTPFDRSIVCIDRVLSSPVCHWKKKPHSESEDDFTPAVEMLLRNGVSPIAKDKNGNLPFFTAAAASNVALAYPMVLCAAKAGFFDNLCGYQPTSI